MYLYNRRLFFAAGFICCSLMAGPGVWAADSGEELFDMSLEQLMDIEIDTVVTASKYEQTVAEAPAMVTTLTANDIRRYGYRTVLDILNSVPGFYTTYDRNYGYIGVRGFGRPGDYNSRILLLIDGHRMNENVGDSLLLTEDFLLDVDLIKKVEIVRGPGSALYGSNAFFAVVHIFTKTGQDYKGFEASSSYDSQDASKNRLTYGNTFRTDGDVLVSGSLWDNNGETLYYPEYDDLSSNYGRVTNDDEQSKNFFVRTSWSELSLMAGHNEREKGIPTGAFETLFGDRGTRTQDDTTLIGLAYQTEIDESLSMLGRVSYHHYNYDGRYVYDDGGIYTNNDWYRGRWWNAELQFTKTFSDWHKVIMGAETQYNVRQDQKNWDSDVYLDSRQSSKSWGMYIQDELQVHDKVNLYTGLRQDYFESVGHKVNPRAGVVYQHTNDTWIKLLYGKAFRVASVYERYYEDSLTQRASPEVDPETIKTWEVIFEKYLDTVWRATTSLYYNKIEDLIDQSEDENGLIYFENLSEVTAKGVETALEGKWKDGTRMRLAYCWVETLDKMTRSELANSPEHMVSGNWIIPLLPESLFAGIETKYMTKRGTLAGDDTDDAWILNLTLTYENLVKNLDVQMGVFNMFDTSYDHPASAEHLQDMLEQDGRTVGFKVNYRF